MTARLANQLLSSGCAVAGGARDEWCGANSGWPTHNRVLGEAFGASASDRIDLVLLDDRGLVTGAYVLFVGAHAAARIRSEVFNLAYMTAATLHVS